MLSTGLDSTQILKGLILLIFDKALDEPKYSSMYAQLCRKLCEEAPNFDPPSTTSTFRRLLLAKCKDEFENRSKATEDFELRDGPLSTEEEEQRCVAKHKMLGNIKFIGELGKQGLLQEAILHQCIRQLLAKKKRQGLKDTAEDLECLGQIMKTVGRSLDTDKAKSLMDQYFERMKSFACNPELPSRIRFMLQDVLELRHNKWVPRRATSEHGPRTIQQIREESARDYGLFSPYNMRTGLPGSGMHGSANQMAHLNNKARGGMDDVFGPLPLGVGTLGTGPGVISADGFPSYSSNMGRPNRNNLNNANSQLYYGSTRSTVASSSPRDLYPSYQSGGTGLSGGNGSQAMQQGGLLQSGRGGNHGGPRDMPPRFLKRGVVVGEEISLRPPPMTLKGNKVATTTINNKTNSAMVRDISTSNILGSSTNISPQLQTMQKESPIVIKQLNSDKNRGTKPISKEEAIKKIEEMLKGLLAKDKSENENEGELSDALRLPRKLLPEALSLLMVRTMDATEADRETVSRIFVQMKKEDLLPQGVMQEALKLMFDKLAELELEVPRVKSFAAGFVSRAVSSSLLTLAESSELLDGGQHYPLFLLCLQQLHKALGKDHLNTLFTQAKINLLYLIPEVDRTKERLSEILEDRGLGFLCPLLRIQSDLWKQLTSDPSPTTLYRYIKDNVQPQQQTQSGFVYILLNCLIKYITGETTLGSSIDPSALPDKPLIDKEKELLYKFKPVFQAFLTEQLQLVALYALQVHCHSNNFPKGMLLRWFMAMYDLEIVEEEAFLKWKEDVNDEYPGKGNALFQVNQWLTWLEEAEEEEGSDGEN